MAPMTNPGTPAPPPPLLEQHTQPTVRLPGPPSPTQLITEQIPSMQAVLISAEHEDLFHSPKRCVGAASNKFMKIHEHVRLNYFIAIETKCFTKHQCVGRDVQ